MEPLSLIALSGGKGRGSQGILVGNVKSGDSFPTTRPDGTALKNEDYVRPVAPFPFTIGGLTFTNVRDKAYYTTAGWLLDSGVIQDTSETPVKDKATESISGTSTTQKAINTEVAEELKKVKGDNATIERDATTKEIKVKNSGINTAQLKDDAVTIAKINDSAIATTISDSAAAVDTKLTTEKATRTALNLKVDKTTKVGSNALSADITAEQIDNDIKEVTNTYKNKTISADDNTIQNLDNENFKNQLTTEAGKTLGIDTDGSVKWLDTDVKADNVTIDKNTAKEIEVKIGGIETKHIKDTALATTISDDAAVDTKLPTEKATRTALDLKVDKTTKVGSNALSGDITSQQLDDDIKDVTNTYTNKTINADHNTISELETDNFKNGVVTTTISDKDSALDTKIPSEKATRTELDKMAVTLTKELNPTAGYFATYTLKQDTNVLGKIDIPKDYLIKSAELKTCTADDNPVVGYKIGDKYIDFVVNVAEDPEEETEDAHIYVNLKDLMDVYTAGDGITIDVNKKISAAVDDSTLEIASEKIHVKDAGIDTAQIKDDAVTKDKINESAKVVYEDDTQTITNKTINAENNTISNLANTNFKNKETTDKGKVLGIKDDGSIDWIKGSADVDNVTIEENTSAQLQVKESGLEVKHLKGDAVSTTISTDAAVDTKLTTEKATRTELDKKVDKTTKVGSNALSADITAQQIDDDIKELETTYKNKTINADNNTISDLETDNFKSDAIATTISDDASVNTKLTTEKAVKTHVDDVRMIACESGFKADALFRSNHHGFDYLCIETFEDTNDVDKTVDDGQYVCDNFFKSSAHLFDKTSDDTRTIQSVNFSLSKTPYKALIYCDYTGTGTVTLYFSKNGGTDWTQVQNDTLTDINSLVQKNVKIKIVMTGKVVLKNIAWGTK